MSTEPPPPQPAAGPRALRLQQVYAASLQRTLDKLSWDNVQGCYPTVARRAEPVLRQVQTQMVDKLREKCEREFEAIMASREVVSKLNALEGLIADAEARRKAAAPRGHEQEMVPPTPPHLMPPNELLAAHLSPQLTAHQSLVNARLQTTQAQTLLLADHVRQQRAEIDALLDALDVAVEDVRGANEVLGPVADELAKEAREADAEVGRK